MADPTYALGPVSSLADIERIEAALPLAELEPVCTTYRLLARRAALSPDATALRFLPTAEPRAPVQEWTYQSLLEQVDRHASALTALIPETDRRTAHILPNLPETHITVLGGQAVGAVCPVNPALSADMVAQLLSECDISVLFCWAEPEFLAKARAVKDRCDSLRHLVVIGDAELRPGEMSYSDMLALASPGAANMGEAREPGEIAALYLTGGTTAAPKVARLSHRNIAVQAHVMAGLFDLSPKDRFGLGLPLFHVHGGIPNSLSVLARGATLVMLTPAGFRNPAVIDHFWDLAGHHGITAFCAVPTVYSALAQTATPAAAKSLRYCVSGSAPLSRAVIDQFRTRSGGVPIVEGYGLTEATCVSTLNPVSDARRRGSVGLRVPYQDMMAASIEDRSAVRPCATREVGRILVRGPNVFEGYQSSAKNAGVLLQDGWLDTGDLGWIDADGFVFLSGRAKDVIKRGGHSIEPLMIEDALYAHPGVALCAAVGMPDAHAGEVPVAYVTLKPRAGIKAEALKDFARAHVADRAAGPVAVHVLEALPTTPVGKIFKPDLRVDATVRAARATLDQSPDTSGAAIRAELVGGRAHLTIAPIHAGQTEAIRGALGWIDADITFETADRRSA